MNSNQTAILDAIALDTTALDRARDKEVVATVHASDYLLNSVYLFIWQRTRVSWRETSPSVREIMTEFELTSTSVTAKLLKRMRAAGLIEWEPNRARTLRVKKVAG